MDALDRLVAQWHAQRPDLDASPMAPLGRLMRLHAHMTQAIEQTLHTHGLSIATFDVLATLRRAGPPHALAPGALLASCLVTSGTMTHRIGLLEKAGLVVREPHPDDKRSVLVRLTPAGLARVDAAVEDHLATERVLLDRLPAEAQAQLDQIARAYLASFEPAEGPSADVAADAAAGFAPDAAPAVAPDNGR